MTFGRSSRPSTVQSNVDNSFSCCRIFRDANFVYKSLQFFQPDDFAARPTRILLPSKTYLSTCFVQSRKRFPTLWNSYPPNLYSLKAPIGEHLAVGVQRSDGHALASLMSIPSSVMHDICPIQSATKRLS